MDRPVNAAPRALPATWGQRDPRANRAFRVRSEKPANGDYQDCRGNGGLQARRAKPAPRDLKVNPAIGARHCAYFVEGRLPRVERTNP